MGHAFLDLNEPVSRTDLALYDRAKVGFAVPGLAEPLATAHWFFGAGQRSFIDVVAGALLTVQAGTPSFSNLSVTVTGIGNALLMPFADATDQTVVVIKKRAATGSIFAGALSDTATEGGSGLLSASSDPTNTASRVRGVGAAGMVVSLPWPGPSGSWIFHALAESGARVDALNGRQTLHLGSISSVLDLSAVKGVAPRLIGIGAAWGGAAGSHEFMEAIYCNRGLSVDELDGVYARAKARAAARGITIA